MLTPGECVRVVLSFTPYTIFSIEATCTRFLPGFPTVVDIQDTAMQLQARLDSPVFRLHYIAVSAAASVTPTPAQVSATHANPVSLPLGSLSALAHPT